MTILKLKLGDFVIWWSLETSQLTITGPLGPLSLRTETTGISMSRQLRAKSVLLSENVQSEPL